MKMFVRCFLLVALACVAVPRTANGQTLLRWKLKPAESLNLEVEQTTESQVAFSGKSANTKIELKVELEWVVTAADDREIKLRQSIKRLKLQLQSPQGGVVEYDSSAQARPTGRARDLADSLQTLIGAQIALTMTSRGEIVAAEPANETAKLLWKAAGQAADPAAASRSALNQVLRQSLIVLPEKPVAENDTWAHSSQISGAAGDYAQHTTYRVASLSDENGEQIAVLELSATLEPAQSAPPAAGTPSSGKRPATGKLKLKEHTQSGTIRFAASAGRVTSAEQTQQLVTERPYRETTIVVSLSSKQNTNVTAGK